MGASRAHLKTAASSQARLTSITLSGHGAQPKAVAARIARLQRLLVLEPRVCSVAHDDAALIEAEKHAIIIDDDDAPDDPDRECLLSKYLALVLLLVLSAFIYFVLVQRYLMAAI